MSKGSRRRPAQVSDDHVQSEWDRIFKKPVTFRGVPIVFSNGFSRNEKEVFMLTPEDEQKRNQYIAARHAAN